MYLLIDVGNTRIKWQLVTEVYNKELQSSSGSLNELASYIETLDVKAVNVLLATVNQTEQLENLLSGYCFKSIESTKSKSVQLGLKNSYDYPERMGIDRWLAMIAVYVQVKDNSELKGIIVVDAGSALTIDVANANGIHQGGYIVPGLQMAKKALFANTERVVQYDELASKDTQEELLCELGNNTIQCVEYGVKNQMIALVKLVQEKYSGYEVFYTGGDGEMLADYLKTGTVDKDLVLKGLWQVRN